MLNRRKWLLSLTVIGAGVAGLVVAKIPAGGVPEGGDSRDVSALAADSPVRLTRASNEPADSAGRVVRDDVPYEDVVWPWEDNPGWLERRATLLRDPVLKLSGRGTASDRISALAPGSGRYRMMSDSQLREVLPFFPEIRTLWLKVDDLSDAGLESTRALPYLETLVLRGSEDAEGERPQITAKGMAALSHHQRLRHLGLHHLRIDDEEFAQLGELQSIQMLYFSGSDLTPRCFQTIAQWPAIRHIGVGYQDWNEPIDRTTHRAVASLDGRLSILAFGGDRYSVKGNSRIHPSLIRAVSDVHSLTQLILGDIDHLSPEDLEPIRKLNNLFTLDAAWPQSAEVRERLLELEREMRARRRHESSSAGNQPSGERP